MTNKERELFEECKLQFIHIHNVIGRKQFSSTKNLIKAIDKALILPVVVKSVKERRKMTFEEWAQENEIVLYVGRYYAGTNVCGWTKREVLKIYEKDTNQL